MMVSIKSVKFDLKKVMEELV